ncbi:hypothetical protein [Streptomyces sp. NPDC047009]|uniref:hypothetical protein n=1 Tax=Streptomyces sp. NPDC047009 TaxID=3154496 RepID=UPI0033E3ECC5
MLSSGVESMDPGEVPVERVRGGQPRVAPALCLTVGQMQDVACGDRCRLHAAGPGMP